MVVPEVAHVHTLVGYTHCITPGAPTCSEIPCSLAWGCKIKVPTLPWCATRRHCECFVSHQEGADLLSPSFCSKELDACCSWKREGQSGLTTLHHRTTHCNSCIQLNTTPHSIQYTLFSALVLYFSVTTPASARV